MFDDFPEFNDKDISDELTINAEGEPGEGPFMEAGPHNAQLGGQDHPGLALIDMAIDQSVIYCKKHAIPEPNLTLWEDFSRPLMNKSLWHYVPTGADPESPALCLALGLSGIGAAYIPVIMHFHAQKQKETQQLEGQDKPPVDTPKSKINQGINPQAKADIKEAEAGPQVLEKLKDNYQGGI